MNHLSFEIVISETASELLFCCIRMLTNRQDPNNQRHQFIFCILENGMDTMVAENSIF
mgnify:CR=1 FL=1